MAYLIDSDVAILDLDDDADTIGLLERLTPAGISISVITYMELSRNAPNARTASLRGSIRRVYQEDASRAVLDVDRSPVRRAARNLDRSGASGTRSYA